MKDAISRAEKKLRQADFFIGHLVTLAVQHRTPEFMEFYLSAALTAAQSAFYVLRDGAGRAFEKQHKRWRRTRTQEERTFLNRMIRLRDDDVHAGTMKATSLDKFVTAHSFHRVMTFDAPGEAMIEEKNPDGSTVRGPALGTVPTLYIDHAGKRIEATTACQQFIALLSDLVQHFKTITETGATT
jgi:hypothetical protein